MLLAHWRGFCGELLNPDSMAPKRSTNMGHVDVLEVLLIACSNLWFVRGSDSEGLNPCAEAEQTCGGNSRSSQMNRSTPQLQRTVYMRKRTQLRYPGCR